MKIILYDVELANVTLEKNGKKFSLIQLGMANLSIFDEEPQFHAEAESFR